MEKHILTMNKFTQAQVCSEGTWEEALNWIRSKNPAGTSNNWSKHEGDNFLPVKCLKFPERTHYMFEC